MTNFEIEQRNIDVLLRKTEQLLTTNQVDPRLYKHVAALLDAVNAGHPDERLQKMAAQLRAMAGGTNDGR